MDEDTTRVRVISVEPGGTVSLGHGETEDGSPVRFAGDWRPMRDIAEALERGEEVYANVPSWAFL